MSDRPRVVLLSHQACTGGTLWMRTLGAMDGVRTLSEISADAEPEPGRFAPLAPIEQYALAEGVDWLPDLVTDQVLRVATHCHDNGSVLLLRLHSHSSFVRKGAPGRDTLLGRLRARDDIEAHAVWTIRHPVASYASLVKNRWHGGHTLESYSRAYRAFVAEQVEIEAKGPFRYESLTESPDETLRAVCDAVQLPYSQQYRDRYHGVVGTGNSGRGARMRSIRPLPFAELELEAQVGPEFEALCRELGYSPSVRDYAREAAEATLRVTPGDPNARGILRRLDGRRGVPPWNEWAGAALRTLVRKRRN